MANLLVTYYPYIIFQWCLFSISTIAVAIRLYVQIRFRARPWRELFVITAWLLYLGYTICDSLLNDWNWYNMSVSFRSIPDSELVGGMVVSWMECVLYKPTMYACKAALLCLYMDLSPRIYFPKTWWVIVFCWGLVISGWVLQIIESFAAVRPLSDVWLFSRRAQSDAMRMPWMYATWSLHLSTDTIVYLIPIIILQRNLKSLTWEQKRGAIGIFALGFINIVSGAEYLIWTVRSSATDITVIMASPVLMKWLLVQNFVLPFQIGSAVIIICLPYCRRLAKGTSAERLSRELGRTPIPLNYPRAGNAWSRSISDHDLERSDARDSTRKAGRISDEEGAEPTLA